MKQATQGWLSGFVGVATFAGSLPATRIALQGFDPTFLTVARASIAGLLGLLFLLLLKQPRPNSAQISTLLLSAMGVVVGFPLLTGFALQYVTSAHCVVFVGLLPICTALFAVLRGSDRPSWPFWLFSLVGATLVAGYAALGAAEVSLVGDGLMLAAIVACGMGYAEGARLARVLGGWQVICWSLVVSLPVMLPLLYVLWPSSFTSVSTSAWLGLGYVSLFSMLFGFIFWYRGLALGGIAAVSQLQLIQPFMGFLLAAWLLQESISLTMLWVTLAAVLCVAGAKQYS
ncbi:DMT family transporter [Marinomonas fungiae]|uniref:EamA-like transporter family n=1 Tax=Marinomonas fungiae TaxID=1137284 RepID=A0A0K6IKZ9_9GAMM|nr:DMT family transporter [Marinomonas fungiae]CUB03774.1 EamA-like transporter family [Marinomonas fungiae]